MFRVMTRFHHVFLLPIIPVCGALALEDEEGDIVAYAKARLSLRSLLLAWARALCFGAAAMLLLVASDLKPGPGPAHPLLLALAGVGLALVGIATWWVRPLTHATYERAVRI